MIYANVVKFHGSLMVSLYAEDKTAFALCTKSPPVSQALLTRMQTSLKLCLLTYCVLIFCVLGVGGANIGTIDITDLSSWAILISMISVVIIWGGASKAKVQVIIDGIIMTMKVTMSSGFALESCFQIGSDAVVTKLCKLLKNLTMRNIFCVIQFCLFSFFPM